MYVKWAKVKTGFNCTWEGNPNSIWTMRKRLNLNVSQTECDSVWSITVDVHQQIIMNCFYALFFFVNSLIVFSKMVFLYRSWKCCYLFTSCNRMKLLSAVVSILIFYCWPLFLERYRLIVDWTFCKRSIFHWIASIKRVLAFQKVFTFTVTATFNSNLWTYDEWNQRCSYCTKCFTCSPYTLQLIGRRL